jgi:hypothetical protein
LVTALQSAERLQSVSLSSAASLSHQPRLHHQLDHFHPMTASCGWFRLPADLAGMPSVAHIEVAVTPVMPSAALPRTIGQRDLSSTRQIVITGSGPVPVLDL